MKVLKTIGISMLLVITVIFFWSAISAFIRLRPPASVTTVPFRMILQMTMKFQIPLLGVLAIILGFVIVKQHGNARWWMWGTLALAVISLSCELIAMVRIKSAATKKNQIEYECITPGSGRETYHLTLSTELKDALALGQCNTYQDLNSPYRDTCLIYLNYGGWAVQDESYGEQIKKFCEKEGYTFIQFALDQESRMNICDLRQEINHKLNELLSVTSYQHVFLCGGSAGGHLALLCGLAQDSTECNLEAVDVDGILAFYPCVDPGYTYDYFVNHRAKELLGHLGNKIYCSLYQGTTGTLAGETQKLDEEVFGERDNPNSYYETSAIKNNIGKDIPILLVQGEFDSMIPVEAARNLYQAMSECNAPMAYLELPCTEHVFDLVPSVPWNRCEKDMTGFIRSICE